MNTGKRNKWIFSSLYFSIYIFSYIYLAIYHQTFNLLNIKIHESGDLNFVEVIFYSSHFLAHLPVHIVVAFLFVGSFFLFGGGTGKIKKSATLIFVTLIIFVILYLQFNSVATTALVFSGIAVAWSGGFIMIWLYAQPWFLDFSLFGTSMRELFQVHPFNLSVAIWVGFLALFGIASDDGVVMATTLIYLVISDS